MEFSNLSDYIAQVYSVALTKDFVVKNAPALTYLKLVRAHSHLSYDPVGQNATAVFSDALHAERVYPERAKWLFKLADLHEIIETMIQKANLPNKEKSFNSKVWADDINS